MIPYGQSVKPYLVTINILGGSMEAEMVKKNIGELRRTDMKVLVIEATQRELITWSESDEEPVAYSAESALPCYEGVFEEKKLRQLGMREGQIKELKDFQLFLFAKSNRVRNPIAVDVVAFGLRIIKKGRPAVTLTSRPDVIPGKAKGTAIGSSLQQTYMDVHRMFINKELDDELIAALNWTLWDGE